jgi:penicillin-binding protein 1A
MRFLGWLLSVGLVMGMVGGALVMLLIAGYAQGLPDVAQLQNYNPPVVSRMHAGDGRLMAEFASERRVFVPVGRFPQRVLDAFLSAEDKNFYDHPGVDFTGVARAIVVNAQNMGRDRRPVGASTITQQVAKNFLIGNEVSIARKVREAILAFRIERAYTKDEILELYLNEIFLGQRAYGVPAAALAYFNKTLDELTVAEVAYLASLPKAPNNYHPVRNKQAALERRDWVLGRMLDDGKITKAQFDLAKAEPIEVKPRAETEFYRGGDYFTEEVRRELVQKYGEEQVLSGGLLVRATVDPRLQDIATRVLRAGLIRYDRRHGYRGPVAKVAAGEDVKAKLAATPLPPGGEMWQLAAVTAVGDNLAEILLKNGTRGTIAIDELKWAKADIKKTGDVLWPGMLILVDKTEMGYSLQQIPAVQGALVAIDPNTGRVLAMVGGFSPRMSVFNRATQALRQPGSSFKPFAYLAALESGFTPASLILDAPISLPQGPGLPEWRPANFSDDFLGPTTLRVGMEKSRNVMTVRLAIQIGIEKIAQVAEAFGVTDKLPRNLSMVLGSGETTVLRMTTAYAQIVNGGRKITPTLIDSIQDKEGRIIYKHDQRSCQNCTNVVWRNGLPVPSVPDTRPQLVDARSAYQMVHILEGVVQRGTGGKARGLPWPLAGKTGTTNDYKDNWFVGFSSDLAVGLYIGFDQPRDLGGKSETGGANSAPIFRDFMADALAGTPPIAFRVPPGLRLVRVNAPTGRLAAGGEANTIWEAFKPGTEPRPGMIERPVDPAYDPAKAALPNVIRMPENGSAAAVPNGQGIPSYLPPATDGELGEIY